MIAYSPATKHAFIPFDIVTLHLDHSNLSQLSFLSSLSRRWNETILLINEPKVYAISETLKLNIKVISNRHDGCVIDKQLS